MADKLLDDDDIIDLTDLLEEGEPKKKEKEKKGVSPVPANKPDSFDLGKEISMEYEVSVEEIEQGNEGIDIDASLSSNEEGALSQEREGAEVAPISGDTAEATLDNESEKRSADTALAASLGETEDSLSTVSEETIEQAPEKHAQEPLPTVENAGGLERDKLLLKEPERVSSIGQGSIGMEGEPMSESVQNLAYPQITEDILCELRKEVPAMLEGIVKPLMTELVKEIIAATREQLPGIVEKVIREEIEKLKKLDS